MGITKMGITKKSATKPNKRFWEGGIVRMMKRLIPNKLKMRMMAAVARKHPRVISTNKKHHKHATVPTDSADNRVVEEPKPTRDEDNVTNDEATEDATTGDAIADEPPEAGTFAAHHTNNEHHEDATVAADSAVNQAKASEDTTMVNGIADEPCEDEEAPEFNEDGDNSTDHEAPGDTNTENGIVNGLTEVGDNSIVTQAPRDTNTENGTVDGLTEVGDNSIVDKAPGHTSTENGAVDKPPQDGDNSIVDKAPGHTNTENGTVNGLTAAQTSSVRHAQDVSRIPQPPVGETAVQHVTARRLLHRLRQDRIRRFQERQRLE